jgi:hypothetical protein
MTKRSFRRKQLSLSLDRNNIDESAVVSESDTIIAKSVKVIILTETTYIFQMTG